MKTGAVVWFTGLPCAGKTTIADEVARYLEFFKVPYERLDGDDVRNTLSKGLGFSKEDRTENLKRVAFVARRLARHGVIVLASFVSPYIEQREMVSMGVDNFIEVFVDADNETCMERDIKGMWTKAIKGRIPNFTGYTAPYEKPLTPNITCYTTKESITESTNKVLKFLMKKDLI